MKLIFTLFINAFIFLNCVGQITPYNTPGNLGENFPEKSPMSPSGGTIYASSTQLCTEDSVRLFFNKESDVTSFTWYKDGFPIANATYAPLDVKEAGNYYIKMQLNTGEFVNSNTVTINLVPSALSLVATATGNTSFCSGGAVTLNSNVNNSIQWQKDKININNAFTATYVATAAGKYRIKYSSGTCPTFSNEITVTLLNGNIPIVTELPHVANPCTGDTINLSVNITGIQWQRNGVDLPGETSNILKITGNGVYRAKANDACSSLSNEISVTYYRDKAVAPVITAGGSVSICNGGTVTLVSSINGVIWQKNGVTISGANNQYFAASTTGEYKAVLQGFGCGLPAYSNSISVTINNIANPPAAPYITQLSYGGKYNCYGTVRTLSSNVAGVQWQKNGINIPGETGQLLNINDNGVYRAVLVNVNGTGCNISSNELTITYFDIPPAPKISIVGTPTFCVGSTITLTADIDNVDWYKDDTRLLVSGKTLSVTESGNYTARYSTSGPCIGIPSNTINIQLVNGNNPPVINAQSSTVICTSSSVVLNSNQPNVQWQKNGQTILNSTGNSFSASDAGLYRAFSVNNSGCNAFSNTIEVQTVANNLPAPVIALIGNNPVVCPNAATTLYSNINNIQWQLNGVDLPGSNNMYFSISQPGNYRAYIPGSIACGSSYSNTIIISAGQVLATPTITANGSTNFCKGGSVELTSNIPGVKWQKSYTDIPNSTGSSLIVKESGFYTAYLPPVASTNACPASMSNLIDVNVADTVKNAIITATNNFNSICNGDSISISWTGYMNDAFMGFQWQKDGVNIPGANNAYIYAKQTGFYRLLINSTCSGLPVITNAIGVSVSSLPTVRPTIAASSNSICSGTALLVSNISSVKWQKDGVDIPNAIGQTYSVSTSGMYRAIATSTNTCNLPSDNIFINGSSSGTTNTSVSIYANGSTTICSGNSVLLATNTNNIGFQWQKDGVDIPGARYLTYRATQPGVYRLYYISSSCNKTYSNEVTVSISNNNVTIPVISAANTNFCSGSAVSLTSNNPDVQWLKEGIPTGIFGNNFNATASGNYSVVTNDNTGCNISSNIISVKAVDPVTPIVTLSDGNISFCRGNGYAILQSNIKNVQWQKDGADIVSGGIYQTLFVSEPGIYRCYVPGTLNCGGNFSNSFAISVYPSTLPTISNTGGTTTCFGGSITLNANLTGVQWYKNGELIAGATAQNYLAQQTGNYSVSFTQNGCTVMSNNIPIYVLGAPPVISTRFNPTICGNNGVQISSNITSGSVQWQKDEVDIPGATNFTFTANAIGNYRMYITNTGGVCGNTFSNVITVNQGIVPASPTIVASGTTNICEGGNVTLTSTIDGIVWQKDFVTVDAGAYNQTYTATTAGTYRAVKFADGCGGYSNPITVTVTPVPTAPIITADGETNICDGTSVNLISNIAGVTWQKDTISTKLTGATYSASAAGTYRAVAIGQNNCNAYSNNISVTVIQPAIKPIITASGATTFCTGGSVLLVSNIPGIIWQKDYKTVPKDSTKTTYYASDSGTYRAVYFGVGCPGYSNGIKVTLTKSPYSPIAYRITPLNNCDTGVVVIASTVTPPNTATIVWQKDTIDIPGSNNVKYNVLQSGNYRLTIYQPGACVSYSNFLNIKTNTTALPVINWNGSLLSTSNGFTTYQWFLNGLPISGANSATFRPVEVGKYRVVGGTGNGCSFASDEFTLVITAVNNVPGSTSNVITMYPNPAVHETWIDIGQIPIQKVFITISNSSGAVLKNIESRRRLVNIPTMQLANGMYLVTINYKNKITNLKLLVSR